MARVDNRVVDNRMVDTRVVDNRVVDNRVVDNRVVDNRVVDNRVADNRSQCGTYCNLLSTTSCCSLGLSFLSVETSCACLRGKFKVSCSSSAVLIYGVQMAMTLSSWPCCSITCWCCCSSIC